MSIILSVSTTPYIKYDKIYWKPITLEKQNFISVFPVTNKSVDLDVECFSLSEQIHNGLL